MSFHPSSSPIVENGFSWLSTALAVMVSLVVVSSTTATMRYIDQALVLLS